MIIYTLRTACTVVQIDHCVAIRVPLVNSDLFQTITHIRHLFVLTHQDHEFDFINKKVIFHPGDLRVNNFDPE